MKEIVIIGHGGHSKVIQDIVARHDDMKVSAILDDRYHEQNLEHDVCLGPISDADSFLKMKNRFFVIAIGNNLVRKQLVQRLKVPEDRYITFIHNTAIISPSARVGNGTVVMANVVINADTSIGKHSIINTGAIIEHDNLISHYTHISPGAILTGNVHIGEGTQIGAGATVIPECRIGEWCIVGAGSTVIGHIPNQKRAVGSPARILE